MEMCIKDMEQVFQKKPWNFNYNYLCWLEGT